MTNYGCSRQERLGNTERKEGTLQEEVIKSFGFTRSINTAIATGKLVASLRFQLDSEIFAESNEDERNSLVHTRCGQNA